MSKEPQPKKRRKWLYIIGGMMLLCICGAIGAALSPLGENAGRVAREEPTAVLIQPEVPEETAVPTNTPAPDGHSREQAVPVGQEVAVSDMLLKIVEIERPADQTIAEGNRFNGEPEPGNEAMIITISTTCTKPSSQTCLITPGSFQLSGSAGVVRNIIYGITGLPNELDQTEFFGGASVSGWIAFEVQRGEENLILSYEPLFSLTYAYLQAN